MRAKRPFDWVRFQRRDLLLIDHPLCQAVFSRQGAQLLHSSRRANARCCGAPANGRPSAARRCAAASRSAGRGSAAIRTAANGRSRGWARQREWRLLDAYADESKVVVSWQLDLEDWHVRLDARLGQRLELELCSYHEEDDDCLFSFALQPYWRVGALSRVVVHGMELESARGQRRFADSGNLDTARRGQAGALPSRIAGAGGRRLEPPLADRQERQRRQRDLAPRQPPGGAGRAGRSGTLLCIGAAGYRPGGLILAPGERMRLNLAAGLQ